ncbi:Y-family DNA polymerase [Hansschlegelia quercus]|uniref:DNA polymerase Y family protein n=1 Tax=Hansschlegelia quercus TaxID=2528245 RepID=A0A4Q9GG87_9HYPH|nr:DNA polymerase Y family protein [Hansschlegelia quercus]TBN51900.1 DNA polymerase Y family protein [Hansschlegelia quercus]
MEQVSAPATPGRRILAIALPSLAIDRIRRRERSRSAAPDDRPLGVVSNVRGLLRLTAVDARAVAAGCQAGAALGEARGICPELRVEPADEHGDASALDAIADWCDRYTPLVGLDGPAGLALDVTGCAHFFGGEKALADDLVTRLAAQGFCARVAVAGTMGTARALAWFTPGGVAALGEEAARVGELPIGALRIPDDARLGLTRAGLRTVAAVAARGRTELAARFGASLVTRLDETLGTIDPPISPRRPAPSRMVERRFAEPLAQTEAALAVLRALGLSLGRRLELSGEGIRRAEAAFFRTDGGVARIAIGLGAPTRDPDLLLRLFRERIDALADPLDPGFGFDMIRLSAPEAEPLLPEERDFRADEREIAARDLDELVDRLSAREGRGRVLRAFARDAHRPEAEAELSSAQGSRAVVWAPLRPEGEPPRRPLRLFARPEAVDVLAEVPDGPPIRFVWRRAVHRVARAEGPERVALEWWRVDEAPLTRDYFRVEDEAGARFWLFRDGLFVREVRHPRWYLHGLFA